MLLKRLALFDRPTFDAASFYALALVGLLFGAFLFSLEEVVDRPLAIVLQAQGDNPLITFAAATTDFGKAHWFLVPSAALFLLARFWWRRNILAHQAAFVFACVAASGLTVDVLKVVFGRTRPILLLTEGRHSFYSWWLGDFGAKFFSFPSGHAAVAAAAALAFSVLLPRFRLLWMTFGLALISTRVLTTAHYLSDALASIAVAITGVVIVKALFERCGFHLSLPALSAASDGGMDEKLKTMSHHR